MHQLTDGENGFHESPNGSAFLELLVQPENNDYRDPTQASNIPPSSYTYQHHCWRPRCSPVGGRTQSDSLTWRELCGEFLLLQDHHFSLHSLFSLRTSRSCTKPVGKTVFQRAAVDRSSFHRDTRGRRLRGGGKQEQAARARLAGVSCRRHQAESSLAPQSFVS